MARFYRILSRLRFTDEKPTLQIGGDPTAPTGFVEKYSEVFRSRRKAQQELRDLRRLHPFGEHRFQEIEIDEGIDVKTDLGVVASKANPLRRRR